MRLYVTDSLQIRKVLLLRSADLKATASAIDYIRERFADAQIFLVCQKSVVEFFKTQVKDVILLEYPFRDFNLAAPKKALKNIPVVDLALSLYKNNGSGYQEVDAFLLNRIEARHYGSITGDINLIYHRSSIIEKQIRLVTNLIALYGASPAAMFRSNRLSLKHCPNTSSVCLSRNSYVYVDQGGKFEIAPHSICRVGYVPPEWKNVRYDGNTRVRIQKNGIMKCDGSINLFSGVIVNVFPKGHLQIGQGSYIAFDSKIFVQKRVEIGNNCAISWDVEIMDTDFHRTRLQDEHASRSGICIKDHVWIGAGSRIMQGVCLGNNVVVGANSVVTKSFPDRSVIAGNPARLVGQKEDNYRI